MTPLSAIFRVAAKNLMARSLMGHNLMMEGIALECLWRGQGDSWLAAAGDVAVCENGTCRLWTIVLQQM